MKINVKMIGNGGGVHIHLCGIVSFSFVSSPGADREFRQG